MPQAGAAAVSAPLQGFLGFALQLAKVAEQSILPLYQHCAASHKPDGTEVTEADRRAEAAIRARIEEKFPDHSLLGEEFGAKGSANKTYQWVIDPLDGTAWFTLGMPTFGTLIALLEEREPVVGVIHFPVLEETVYAAKGGGCWFKPRRGAVQRVRVDPKTSLNEAMASASGPQSSDVFHVEGETPYRLSGLIASVKKFKFCTDCLQHALVCRGRVHVALDTVMKPWDIAAIVPCVEEAGGVVSDLSGKREGILYGGNLLTSCSRQLHDQALQVLRPG